MRGTHSQGWRMSSGSTRWPLNSPETQCVTVRTPRLQAGGSHFGHEPEEKASKAAIRNPASAQKVHVAKCEAKKQVEFYGESSRFQRARKNKSNTEEYSLVTKIWIPLPIPYPRVVWFCWLFGSTLRQKGKGERVSNGWQNKQTLVSARIPFFFSRHSFAWKNGGVEKET